MVIFVLLMFTGLLSSSWSLNAGCTSAFSNCTLVKTYSIVAQESPCRYMPVYISCISLIFSTSACDELSTLVLRDTTTLEAESTKSRITCSYEIPEALQLNDCQKQKSNCSKLSGYPFVGEDIGKKCKYLETFQSCFDKTTPACEDRGDIARIVNMELTRLQYNSTCVGWQLTTELTSTASLTTRQGSTTIATTTTSTTAMTTTRGLTNPATTTTTTAPRPASTAAPTAPVLTNPATTTTTVPRPPITAAPTTPDNTNNRNSPPRVIGNGGNGGNKVVSSVTWTVLLTLVLYVWART
ncbi:cell wall integrity and stress response component 3-like isoform X2 [Pomacea canaliculata]|uniref:cell wall integrity and stress response component 3-like isoform X2 n=1 Tax=Pomacea canaliculata TaxID=400727 RepID=UPI000D73E1E5|nr:cell wall integrity and stress response component 3-like isoform X2 [Pomacea canaliculata]